MREGWITLHRQIQNNPLWQAQKFTKAQAWIDILLRTNHSDKHVMIRGIKIPVKRGQTATAMKTFARIWRWSEFKVRNFFKYLESEGMIEYLSTNQTTITTVLNYNQYQSTNTATKTKLPTFEDYETWTTNRLNEAEYLLLCHAEEITIADTVAQDHLRTIATFPNMKPQSKKEFYYSLMRHALGNNGKKAGKYLNGNTTGLVIPKRKKKLETV